MYCVLLLVGATEEGQVFLVDVLGNMETVGLYELLVLCQLILVKRKEAMKLQMKKSYTPSKVPISSIY